LDEPTYTHFMGRTWPHLMITACVCSIVGYALIILVFFRFSRAEYKTEQTVMMIGMVVCTVLGLALLTISQPLSRETLQTYTDLFFQCDYGAKTQRLFEYAMLLQNIRARPDCAKLQSVEECAGYQEAHPHTGYLRVLEARYKCAGFCSGGRVVNSAYPMNNLTNATANATANATTGANGTTLLALGSASSGRTSGKLTQALQRIAGRRSFQSLAARGAGELSVEHRDAVLRAKEAADLELREALQESVAEARPPGSSALRPGVIDNYPPTLFSRANYKVSCEGQAARVLKYEALDVARVLYIEGLALLFTTVAISMVKLAGLCDSRALSLLLRSSRGGSRSAESSAEPSRPKEVIL